MIPFKTNCLTTAKTGGIDKTNRSRHAPGAFSPKKNAQPLSVNFVSYDSMDDFALVRTGQPTLAGNLSHVDL